MVWCGAHAMGVCCAVGGSVPTDMSGDIVAGDTVRVDLDLEMVKLLQEGHGGWDDAMAEVCTYTYILLCLCVSI